MPEQRLGLLELQQRYEEVDAMVRRDPVIPPALGSLETREEVG